MPGVCSAAGSSCSRVLLAQMVVGEVQYRNALPWGLVLVHVVLAAAIWALTVALGRTSPVASTGSARARDAVGGP